VVVDAEKKESRDLLATRRAIASATGVHGRLGSESDTGSGERDQGQPGRVGDVPDLREMVATRKDFFSEVKLARRRKSKDQSLTVWM
jgi:hypothetical protein